MSLTTFKILLDLPSEQPSLGFNEYAQALVEIIESSKPQFAVGIFGGWGSGKTTLMKAIASRLAPDKTIQVQFSAWRYEKEQHLIIPLLDTVREALVTWSEGEEAKKRPMLGKAARETAATIGKVLGSLLAGISFQIGGSGALQASFDANAALAKAKDYDDEAKAAKVARSFYYASFQALNKAFEDFTKVNVDGRIVVFIDDLDRCLPEGTLAVLESMKLFFDFLGFVFVVGLDRSVVEWSIETKYGANATADKPSDKTRSEFRVRGADYIKKIFQLPFTLAPVSISQLWEFLEKTCTEEKVSHDQHDDIFKTVFPHLRYIVSASGVNPREVKRYINAYTLLMKVRPDRTRNAVLALQTIAFNPDWQSVQRMLLTYQEVLIDTLNRYFGGDANALEVLDPTLGALPPTFIEYVRVDPGHALLSTPNIKDYIFSGESTRTSENPQFLQALRDLAELRPRLRTITSNSQDSKATASAVSTMIDGIVSRMTSDPTSQQRASDVVGLLKALRENLQAVGNEGYNGKSELSDWQTEQERLLQQALSRLLDYYQFSSF